MKITLVKTYGVLVAASMCAWTANSTAQRALTESTTTTTTSSGTISQYEPGSESLVVRTETGTEPLRYAVTKRTVYVDETGAPIAGERITSGMPITVHYVGEGDRMLASRIVVRRTPAVTEQRTTTTTTGAGVPTSAGTITEFTPGSRTVVVRTESGSAPLRYSVSGDTQYVDETGAPVGVETITSGVPVTVHYARSGDGMVASRIVVRRATVVEERGRKLTHEEKERAEKEDRRERKDLKREQKRERQGRD